MKEVKPSFAFFTFIELDFTASTELDISTVIPLRRQAGFINMLSDIVNRLDKIAKPFLPQLFNNLLSIVWMSCTCLNQYKDQVIYLTYIYLKIYYDNLLTLKVKLN